MDYRDKLVLAPMVRVGTLPFRLLAAQYGADIVYGEEIIDHRLLKCERTVNEMLGSVDFVEKGSNVVAFRTCDEEKGRVVFQMGTSDAVRALKAAQIVHKDVAAVDINMGCPKSFSISGGMGAALLSKPDLIHDILTTLRRNLDTPVTCKIRLLNSSQKTVELARRIEKTGVAALAVHGRKVADRPRDPANWDGIADVVSAVSIPVIANGDVFEYDDFERVKSSTGASSEMVARGALWNASIFSPSGFLPWEDVKLEYVRKSMLWDNDIKSTKHTLREIIFHHSCLELEEGQGVVRSKTPADLAMEVEFMESPLEAKEKVVNLFRESMNRLIEFEKLADEGNAMLYGYRQGLGFLCRPPIKKSDLVVKIIKSNETEGLKSYFGEATRCKNTHDVVENINKLNASHAGLLCHLAKAKALVSELELHMEETVTLIQSTGDASILDCQDTDSVLDGVASPTCLKGRVSPLHTREYKISEYALMTCLICSMVKQEYKMQEKIITSLKFNESEEMESYCLMWSLRPNLNDDLLAMAKSIS